ncbi:hypothetical protein BDF22DRAFT_653474 [Syncephalis plumigaleata]|nr:hypothetical protein BDF22DRAFT_653474 [Syncephalis plumigaleata]
MAQDALNLRLTTLCGIAIIVQFILIAITISHYRKTGAQGHLYLLTPMILEIVWCISILVKADIFTSIYVYIIASYLTIEIIAYHSILWNQNGKVLRGFILLLDARLYSWSDYRVPQC